MTLQKISLIAAASEDWAIGRNGELPWHLPADLRYFKKRTLNKPIIMGRKTFDSIVSPLPKRHNIVVTRNSELQIEGASVVTSLDEALALEPDAPEIMIVGGGELYRAALDRATHVYLTRIHMQVPDADAHFPDFLKLTDDDWLISCEHFLAGENGAPDCTFLVYDRVVKN